MSEAEQSSYLIVGLGNPGNAYRKTRHNVGFNIVQSFAKKLGLTFRQASHLNGEFAQGKIQDRKVLLLMPATFMNLSGESVRRAVDYYNVPLEHLIIASDDVALPVGTMRMRTKGSSGGHNGLKSIEAHLNTQHYARLRIGVGAPLDSDLADFVLAKFTADEAKVIDEVTEKCCSVLQSFVSLGVDAAMQQANVREKKEEPPTITGEK